MNKIKIAITSRESNNLVKLRKWIKELMILVDRVRVHWMLVKQIKWWEHQATHWALWILAEIWQIKDVLLWEQFNPLLQIKSKKINNLIKKIPLMGL